MVHGVWTRYHLVVFVILFVMLMRESAWALRRTIGRTAFRPPTRSSSLAMSTATNFHQDTIYALSSGTFTQSGVAVLRISGPKAFKCLQEMLPVDSSDNIKPRQATLRSLYCPKTKEMLDKSLILWFPGPKSFTGEDVVELHVHGSRAVVSGVFEALEHIDKSKEGFNVRPADRGEFTKRAFENGKMDLTEVEGLSDLLAADTSTQRKQALRQMEGQLRRAYEKWRAELVKCLAHTEAVIDFGDDDREGDINDAAMNPLVPIIRRLRNELEFHLQDGRKGEIIREGIQIVLVGQPNAGKSSLMNALARRPAAIVSPIAGTTRDIVEVRMDIGGVSCIVRDTAGLRSQTSDVIEQEGIKRAREAYDRAHIKVFVVDISSEESIKEAAALFHSLQVKSADFEVDEDARESKPSKIVLVYNKIDLLASTADSKHDLKKKWLDIAQVSTPLSDFLVSCTDGSGLDLFERGLSTEITDILKANESDNYGDEGVLITRERHRRHVRKCVEHLDMFLSGMLPMDLAAEEIRLAMMELGKVTGRVDVEELLDIIFRDFCIGK